ncbi:hypothetical protein KAR91_70335 [Candidatus Pacearchaeota archaeon]|nr:hypothetical protein [Candidatus Pacearchaeota archaeon]
MLGKKEFDQIEDIRQSGMVNMNNVEAVADLSGTSTEEVKEFCKNYKELRKKYLAQAS